MNLETNLSREEIWNLYYPSEEEMKFKLHYIRRYFKYITPLKFEILDSDELLKKYCLISFFNHYRVCNHVGTTFYEPNKTDDEIRFIYLEKIIGKEIRSVHDYLMQIDIYKVQIHHFFIPLSWRLFYFVKPNLIIKTLDKLLPTINLQPHE